MDFDADGGARQHVDASVSDWLLHQNSAELQRSFHGSANSLAEVATLADAQDKASSSSGHSSCDAATVAQVRQCVCLADHSCLNEFCVYVILMSCFLAVDNSRLCFFP